VDLSAPESIPSFESLPPPPVPFASDSRSRPSREIDDDEDARDDPPDLSRVRQRKAEEEGSAACVIVRSLLTRLVTNLT
jgi:hypothetical protein